MGREDSSEQQRRVAQLRDLVAAGRYQVNLEQLAAALIRRGAVTGDAEARSTR